ncbi:hypothetical protein Tco_0962399 [Tanacetum coccineum]
MMLLAIAITQRYYTPTNNHLRTSLNIRNQAVIHDGRVDIQSKNVGYAGNGNMNAGRPNRNQIATARNGMVQQIEMLLAMKDEVGGNLNEEENDFMLDNHYGDDSLEELNAAVILMARIQPTDDKTDAEPTYDVDALGEVNASQIHLKSRMHSESVHKHTNHVKLKTVINTFDGDQIDSSIIFDDPYVDNNGGTDEHDSNAHDQFVALESLIYNVQKEAKNQCSLNNELKKQKHCYKRNLRRKNEMLMLEKEKVSNDSKDIQATMEQRIKILENNFKELKLDC